MIERWDAALEMAEKLEGTLQALQRDIDDLNKPENRSKDWSDFSDRALKRANTSTGSASSSSASSAALLTPQGDHRTVDRHSLQPSPPPPRAEQFVI